MELHDRIREALELQTIEADGTAAAQALQEAILEQGAPAVGDALLDTAAIALRRMVAETEESFVAADLLARLALDGAVPEAHLDLLGRTVLMAAATAGGIRPSVDELIMGEGVQDAMFGLWLALLTVVRVAAVVLDLTEAELVQDVLVALEP